MHVYTWRDVHVGKRDVEVGTKAIERNGAWKLHQPERQQDAVGGVRVDTRRCERKCEMRCPAEESGRGHAVALKQ